MTDDEIRVGIGERVKAARESMGITQRHLAATIGVSEPSIQNIEAGRHAGSVVTIVRIAEAMGILPAELLPRFRPTLTFDKAHRHELRTAHASSTPTLDPC